MELIIIRHGESLGDIKKVHEGRADLVLTELGEGQARKLADWLIENEKIDKIISSPLKRAHKTEEEIRQELRPMAKKRLVQGLVLGKLAEQEKIEIGASEVDNRIDEIVGDAEDKEKARQFFSLPQFRQSIKHSLRSQKTMDHLLQIAVGDTNDMTKGE